MATTFFLPPIVPSPFGKAFARKFHSRSGSKEDTSSRSNNYHHTYPNDSPQTKRTIAVPASSFSPEKPTETKENIRHLPYNKNHLASPSRQACPARTADHSRRSVHSSVGPSHKPSEYTETFPTFEDIRTSTECGSEDTQYYTCVARSTDQSWSWPPDETTKPADVVDDGSNAPDQDCWSPPKHRKATAPPATTTQSDKPLGKAAGNFRRWASTFRHKRGQHRHEVSPRLAMTEVQTDTESALPAVLPRPRWHGKRSSNASSRFVTTIKTASLSNDSMSVLRQSHRYSRVSETRVNRGSDPRSSLDSQKPPSISTDDAALRRSIKRRHILQEILSSEESYVADLKTLHNLFSTLLASMSTISTQTRNSIQRNVTELLHIHEQIVNELHRVALRTTVREWNHVVSPLRHNMKRHRKWQSLDATSFHTPPRHAHPSVSLDVLKMRFLGSSSYVADPAEAADVARIFKNHMARFYVYEEYCAKYEIMVQELVHSHKVAPHWTSYEAGMEALANSIAPLSQRSSDGKKGLRASDLLIKPIQRICKYPLFFGDLQKHTPVVDCPSSHAEVDGVLNKVREMVGEINVATEDPRARERVQRRWLLQDRLKLCHDTSKATQFRMLGPVLLCGVLHVAYQTSTNVEGGYMMCVMFNSHLIVAAPAAEHGKFDVVATICLSDAKAVSTEDGRGLQCHTALFSWKVIFESDGLLFELLFSACSAVEQQQWLGGIERGRNLLTLEGPSSLPMMPDVSTATSLQLKALASVLRQGGTLARRLSIQRAATVGTRVPTCHVIIRNTHKPQEGQDIRHIAALPIDRSQSLLMTRRVTVLAPRRWERVRLEQSLADVWTRDTLPYPGMSLTRGGSIIRASAGTLVRKLSFASIHTPFAKRSPSSTLAGSRSSHDQSLPVNHEIKELPQTEPLSHEVVVDDPDEALEEEKLSEEMVEPPSRLSFTASKKIRRRSTKRCRRVSKVGSQPMPETLPRVSPEVLPEVSSETEIVEDKLGSKKRWSNPLGLLKNLSAEGMRHMLYSSKS